VASLAVVLGLLIVAAIVGTVVTARDFRTGAQEALVRQTAANQLQVNLLNAQSANRAYILLRRGEDLQDYLAARDRYPRGIGRVRAVVRGQADLERAAEAVDFAAQRWYDEAVAQIRLVRQGKRQEARIRVDWGIGDVLFQIFANEHARLLQVV
jgi:CHASE3 domain sensor protein